jgi:hypothetical protein
MHQEERAQSSKQREREGAAAEQLLPHVPHLAIVRHRVDRSCADDGGDACRMNRAGEMREMHLAEPLHLLTTCRYNRGEVKLGMLLVN